MYWSYPMSTCAFPPNNAHNGSNPIQPAKSPSLLPKYLVLFRHRSLPSSSTTAWLRACKELSLLGKTHIQPPCQVHSTWRTNFSYGFSGARILNTATCIGIQLPGMADRNGKHAVELKEESEIRDSDQGHSFSVGVRSIE